MNVGPEGGVFDPNQKTYTLENPGDFPVDYSVTKTVDWLTIENSSGNIPAFSSVDITVSLENSVNSFPPGVYSDTLTFTNLTNGTGDTTRNAGLSILPPHIRLSPPKMVKDIFPGSSSGIHYLAPWVVENSPFPEIDGNIFFIANDGIHGPELWKSDGTAEGTAMVKDINTVYRHITKALDALFFVANDGIHGEELWKSDGTEEGTAIVKDINPTGHSSINHLREFNGYLYFTASNGTTFGLFKTDGTEAGTTMVFDFETFGFSSISYPMATENFILFWASDGLHGWEPWKSDGTEEGTVLLKDINPGTGSSLRYAQIPPLQWFYEINGFFYFAADDGVHGSELWRSDGTGEGTAMVKDINPGSPTGFLPNKTGQNVIGNYFFFPGNDGIHGVEPWKSDGTDLGTVMVKDLLNGPAGSDPQIVTEFKGNAYFVANTMYSSYSFWELIKSDGTEAGTQVLKNSPYGINGPAPGRLIAIDNLLFFGWADPVFHGELWVTDGTEESTIPVTNLLDTTNTNAVHAITLLNRMYN